MFLALAIWPLRRAKRTAVLDSTELVLHGEREPERDQQDCKFLHLLCAHALIVDYIEEFVLHYWLESLARKPQIPSLPNWAHIGKYKV